MAASAQSGTVSFADFTVDLRGKQLRRNDIRLKLPGQPFSVLAMLLEHPGEVVTREELRAHLWQEETFVDFDHSLNVAIAKLKVVTAQASTDTATSFAGGAAQAEKAPEAKPTGVEAAAGALWSRHTRLYAGALAVLLLCAAGVYVARRAWHRAAAPPPKIMLAVLPFDNLTGDPANEYFSDGLTEEMITQLAELRPDQLGVIARTSVMSYKRADKSIGRVAKQLGVQYIVEGSVRQSTGRVRITAQLIQVKDQTHVWAQDYDRDLGDVLTMEREVANSVAREIQVQLTPQQQAGLARPRGIDPEAHELYLKGRFYWNKRTNEAFKKSIEYFNGAIARDPSYAEAYTGLADGYRFLMIALPPDEVMPKARAAAERALALNPNLAEAHASLGLIAPYYSWDWDSAREHLRRAIELNPNYALAHDWYADGYLSSMGRIDESLAELRVAERLDPLSLVILTDIGKTLFFARRYGEAIAQLRAAVEMDPHYFPAANWLWKSYVEKGMYREALDAVELEREGVGRADLVQDLAYIRGRMGDTEEARRLLAQLLKLSRTEHLDPGGFSHIYLALGDEEQAFTWLEKAYAAHSNYMSSLKVWPVYDPVRNDPRFVDLERRVKLIP